MVRTSISGSAQAFRGVAPVTEATAWARTVRPSRRPSRRQPTSAPVVLRAASSMSRARQAMSVAWTSVTSSTTVAVSHGHAAHGGAAVSAHPDARAGTGRDRSCRVAGRGACRRPSGCCRYRSTTARISRRRRAGAVVDRERQADPGSWPEGRCVRPRPVTAAGRGSGQRAASPDAVPCRERFRPHGALHDPPRLPTARQWPPVLGPDRGPPTQPRPSPHDHHTPRTQRMLPDHDAWGGSADSAYADLTQGQWAMRWSHC